MTTVTTLPTPPSRANPGTFADDADAFLGALPTFGTELNAVASEVNGNASAAVAAAAVKNTDNFLGAWSSGTTYAVGESVSKGNLFWLSKQAGNLNHDPETDNGTWWDSVTGFAPDSSTTTAMSADLTLTASSSRIQAVSSTTYGKSVILPSALSLFKSVDTFVITNTGDKPIALRNDSGTLLTSIRGGGTAKASLADNSTAAGVWGVEGRSLSEIYWKRINEVVSTTHTTAIPGYSETIIKLSATVDVLFSYDGTSYYATIYDVSTDTLGSPKSLGTNSSLGNFGRAYATTSGFLLWCNTQLVAATVSGSTITVGTAVTHSFGANGTAYNYPTSFVQLDTDKFCGFLYSGTQPQAKAFTVSTNVITAGTATNIGATVTTAAGTYTAIKRSTTQLIVALYDSGTGTTKFRHITVDASRNVTYDSEVSKNGYAVHCLIDIDTDSYGALLYSGSNTNFYNITVSGTTISSSTGYAVADNSSYWFANNSQNVNKPTMIAVSTTRILFHCYATVSPPHSIKIRLGSLSAILTNFTENPGGASNYGYVGTMQTDATTTPSTMVWQDSYLTSGGRSSSAIGFFDETFPSDVVQYETKQQLYGVDTLYYMQLYHLTSPDRKILIIMSYGDPTAKGVYIYRPDRKDFYREDDSFIKAITAPASHLQACVHTDVCVINTGGIMHVLEVAP